MGYLYTYKRAFKYTIPILTGYLFIGIAFGVMFAGQGYSFVWATLMSIIVYAGSGQYLAVNFFVPGYSLLNIIILTLSVNSRHMFYGLSLLSKFRHMGKKYYYMIFSLTDETYSVLTTVKVPKDVQEDKFLFCIASLNQSYWVIGSIIGSLAGTYIPFNSKGIDFAMTALFLVIFIELALEGGKIKPLAIGLIVGFIAILICGTEAFILPSMIAIIIVLLSSRKYLDVDEENAS